jgi:Lipocalin-like domain
VAGLLRLTHWRHQWAFADEARRPREEARSKSSKATGAEAAQIYPTRSAYGGRYKIDGGKLIVYLEVASSPAPSLTERECKRSPLRVDCA